MKSRRSAAKRPVSSGDEGPSKRKQPIPEPVTPPRSNKSKAAATTFNQSPGTPKNGSDGSNNKKKGKNNKESESSSDEERWLEKIKDPKMMTARQRAMYDRENNVESNVMVPEMLVSLPTGYKEKVMTAEAIERAQMLSAKRKEIADQKREKNRQRTMERLLKKQESKLNKVNKNKQMKPGIPMITYRSTKEDHVLIFPPEYELRLGTENANKPELDEKNILAKLCAICSSPKRYNCSKTNVPLCSFKCYKENISRPGVVG